MLLIYKHLEFYLTSFHTQRTALHRYFYDRQKTFYILSSGLLWIFHSKYSIADKAYFDNMSHRKSLQTPLCAAVPIIVCHSWSAEAEDRVRYE